jgi:hypothetical protein
MIVERGCRVDGERQLELALCGGVLAISEQGAGALEVFERLPLALQVQHNESVLTSPTASAAAGGAGGSCAAGGGDHASGPRRSEK